jgi:peptide/nickel transport system substrate-binding protein
MRTGNQRSRTVKHFVVALVLTVLVFSSVPAPFAATRTGFAQSSCPDNQTLKMGSFGGAPNTFNMLSALPFAGVASSLLQFFEMYPPPTASGSLDYSESVIDWYTVNSNFTQWTFNVRPGLKWSDGTNVTSQDILNTYSTKFALNSSVDFVNAASEIKNIVALNSSAAQFNLNVSDAIFAEKVGSSLFTPIVPKSFVAGGSANNGFGTTDVADGPFYANNYQSGTTQGVFLRNNYFNPVPKACELLINYYESDSSIPQYIQSDAIDFGPIPTSAAASLASSPNVHIIDEKSQLLSVLTYNETIYPYNTTAFRQALVYGINQTQIQQQAYNGYFETAYNSEGGVPQASTAWYSPHQQNYSYSPSTATNLLNGMGIKKGSDGYLQYPNGTDVTLTIWYDNSFGENALAMQIIQKNLQSLGFKSITLNAAALGTLIEDSYANTNNINSQMIYFLSIGPIYGYAYTAGLPSYSIDIPFNPPPSWEGLPSSQAQAEFKSNLTALESTRDPVQQYKYLQNIQSLNAANIPVVTLGYGDSVWAYNSLRWSNWPTTIVVLPNTLNATALALLTPASSSSTTSSSSTGLGGSTLTLIAVAVVVVVVVAAAIAFALRRRATPT